MKTTEKENKYVPFGHRNNQGQLRNRVEVHELNQDLNEERIITTYRPKEKVFYYDNSQICLSYGQYNVEKCLVVLFVLIIYSASLLYNYFYTLDYVNFVLIASSGILDILISFLYLFFLIKLKSEQIFNRIPNSLKNSSDILIISNFVIKIINIVLIWVDYTTLGLAAIILFSSKFIFEFYFNVISVKLFMFCPCTLYIQEQTEKIWNWTKCYVFCCEVEEPENPDYTKLEDLESFY